MATHLFAHIRNQDGHIVATLAINKKGQIGAMFRNQKDLISRKRGLEVAALRSDRGNPLQIPDRWITPQFFAKNKKTSTLPLADLLEIPLASIVQEEACRLHERAIRYFKN
jgi:hypothetical protein